jgi:hypothetical protein
LCSLWVSLCVVQLVGLPVCCAACGSPCVLCSLWVSLCVVQLVGLPVCLSSTDVWPVLNRACHWNTCVRLKIWPPKACWNNVRVSVALFPKLAQNLMHTRCSFLQPIMIIATGHVHDSKWTCVKTAHVHPATCNLAHWLTRHASPTIYRCFALPQLLYRWQHQSGIFSIPPRIWYRWLQDILYFSNETWTSHLSISRNNSNP